MKNNLYKEMYEAYLTGMSLEQVGRMFNMTRQSVHVGFKRRKFKLRKISQLPYKVFDGKKFTLRNNGYYGMTHGAGILMHRYVWEFYNGKIPPKHGIHHKNNDRTDNRISNLELYTKSEHARKFAAGNNQYAKKTVK